MEALRAEKGDTLAYGLGLRTGRSLWLFTAIAPEFRNLEYLDPPPT